MSMKPPNFAWLGFTPEQTELLDYIDFIGNNGWARNSQTEAVMPKTLEDCEKAGLTLDRVKKAMETIGYDRRSIHELDRWESKRKTGRFGR